MIASMSPAELRVMRLRFADEPDTLARIDRAAAAAEGEP
jgi:hypothetical protein